MLKMSSENCIECEEVFLEEPEFILLSVTFPDVIDDKIDTVKFLTASCAVVKMIDGFGKVFTPVKYDMQSNIDKITLKYTANKAKHSTLQELITSEKSSGRNHNATEALIWLARGLRMIQLFFSRIVEAHQMGEAPEELCQSIKESYKESLEPHHGFMAIQLFNLLSRVVPHRAELLLALANYQPGQEETTLILMEIFAEGLKKNLLNLHRFMRSNNMGTILQMNVI